MTRGTLDNDDESGVANDPGYGGNARRVRPSAAVMAAAAADRTLPKGKTATPHDTLNYESVARSLRAEGWRRQEYVWSMRYEQPGHDVKDMAFNGQRIEWWNRGRDFLLVYREDPDGAAIALAPLTRTRLAGIVRRKDDA